MTFHSWFIMFVWLSYFMPFITIRIIFWIAYCIYLLAKKKRFSLRSVLIVCFGTFMISLIPAHGFYIHTWSSIGVAAVFTEVPFGIIYFLLMWGTVCIVRKLMSSREYLVKWRKWAYFAVFLLYFYIYYPLTERLYHTEIYNMIYDFLYSVFETITARMFGIIAS